MKERKKIFNNEHRKSNAKLFYDFIKIIFTIIILSPIAKSNFNFVISEKILLTCLLICGLLWGVAYLFERGTK